MADHYCEHDDHLSNWDIPDLCGEPATIKVVPIRSNTVMWVCTYHYDLYVKLGRIEE